MEKVWYDKLKEEGFEDIEDTNNEFRPLKSWHSFRFMLNDSSYFKNTNLRTNRESAISYYRLACQLLNTHHFKNETHRRIWELHSEGWSKRQIEAEIKDLRPTYKRERIGIIINMIAEEIKF